jgi:hypothetical protein
MEFLAFLPIVLMALVLVVSPYWLSDYVNMLVKTTFMGYKRVLLYDGEYDWSEDFHTVIRADLPPEHQRPFRYNCTKVGTVRLRADGTAEYCGRYRWKFD